jgi:hypothetical protein
MRNPLRFLAALLLAFGAGLPAFPQAKPARAAAPPAKPKVQYIPIKVFKNAAEAEVFLDLAKRKQVVDEDATVLARLLTEKEGEQKELERQLLVDFGLRAEAEYEYDAEKKTVFSKRTDAQGGVTREVVREFKHPESEQDFLKLVAARRLTVNAIATLRLLVLEKDKEKELADQELERRFAVLASKNYYYDASKMTLYEVQEGV